MRELLAETVPWFMTPYARLGVLALVVTPMLAMPMALGLSREKSFGQRYVRAYVAALLGLLGVSAISGLDPAAGFSLAVYALVVLIVLLLWGESLYRSVIGLFAPYAFLFTFVMPLVLVANWPRLLGV